MLVAIHALRSVAMARNGEYYRADGVRITHNPNAPGMAEKYGAPGRTDEEGFDPYADSVGAGIYSGTVQRDERGAVVIGEQYQGHNPRPGPVYSGGGYSPVSKAIAAFGAEVRLEGGAGASTLGRLLAKHPDLVNAVCTGGALPLHTCGMSRSNQLATAFLLRHGADTEAVDSYGYTPLHRMASNNLAVGAQALLDAGAEPQGLPSGLGVVSTTPLEVARQSRAADVVAVLERFGPTRRASPETRTTTVAVFAAGYEPVVGLYTERDGERDVPAGFARVCEQSGWDTDATWRRLSGGNAWFAHATSESYIYYNLQDTSWWIDGPDGLGAFKARGVPWAPPASSIRWTSLRKGEQGSELAGPTLAVYRGGKTQRRDDEAC